MSCERFFTDEEFDGLGLQECFCQEVGKGDTCMRLSRSKNLCNFNLRCKKLEVAPKSLAVPCLVRTFEGHRRRMAERASLGFVRECLRLLERKKRDILDDLKGMELSLEQQAGREEEYQTIVQKKA